MSARAVPPSGRRRGDAAILLGCIGVDGGIDFAHCVEHCLFVREQQLTRAIVGPFHDRVEPAEIEKGAAIAGPTDQIGLMRKGETPVWRPVGAVTATCGNKSAVATPMSAVALANSRSATAMSGRRRNRSSANPRGYVPAAMECARPLQLVAQIFRKLPDQHRNHVSRRFDLSAEWRDLRVQMRQFALRQGHVKFVGDPR